MSPLEMLALDKAQRTVDTKWARDQVVAGKYPVEFEVRVSGMLTVGEDTAKRSTSQLISEGFLILALRMSGCTRERAVEVIEQVASEFLQGWTGSEADKESAKAAREEMISKYDADGSLRKTLEDLKGRLPKTPVRGSVSFKGEVVEIAAAQDARVA